MVGGTAAVVAPAYAPVPAAAAALAPETLAPPAVVEEAPLSFSGEAAAPPKPKLLLRKEDPNRLPPVLLLLLLEAAAVAVAAPTGLPLATGVRAGDEDTPKSELKLLAADLGAEGGDLAAPEGVVPPEPVDALLLPLS